MSIRPPSTPSPSVPSPRTSFASSARSALLAAVVCAVVWLTSSSALAQPFTYIYFPSSTTISTPVTTDFAIVGFSGGQYNDVTLAREFTGPSSPTVTIAAGADIPDAEIFNSSVVNVTGGTCGFVAYDTSTVNIHGGSTSFTLSEDAAVINMYSGHADDLEGQGQRINVYGGTIGTLVANVNTSFDGNTLGSCIVDVFGGTFEAGANLTAFNDGILNLRGGLIQSDFVRAADGATLNIFGTNLGANLINPNGANGYSIYTLSGMLADGSSIDGLQMRIRSSTFNLVNVPAPGAAVALVLPSLLLARRRRR